VLLNLLIYDISSFHYNILGETTRRVTCRLQVQPTTLNVRHTNSKFPASKSCLIHQSHLQQTIACITPLIMNPFGLELPPIGASYDALHLDSPHHLTTFVPTRAPKQRETISERACGPNQLGRISERVYSPSQLRTIFERPRPRKMLKEKSTTQSSLVRIRTTRLMTSLRVSTAGIRENATGQNHISTKRSSRLRCQRKNG
jgi:hypothetical protein